ncbi:hypothetical protein [Arthrobacter sedimenti]|uniref:hypothetical protein n=1 Tax=Arthrobacter sedimenti TaxID=2694931 RepID=UPI00177E0C85|nr:hypothetical protein [Arthrobacter sedimenti]
MTTSQNTRGRSATRRTARAAVAAVRKGTAELFIDAPEGRAAVGLKADVRNKLLFVSGGATGQAYVYDTRTGATVAEFQLTTGDAFINDVTLTKDEPTSRTPAGPSCISSPWDPGEHSGNRRRSRCPDRQQR